MKAILARLGAAVSLCAAAGCSPTVTNHGYRLDPELMAQIRPGVTTRDEVARLLGSPSSVGTFGDKSWYYVTQRTEQMSFYQSKVADQRVVRIDFDPSGVVKAVDQRGLQEARNVAPATEVTPSSGNELTLLQQFVGNIGRFNGNAPEAGSTVGSMARPGMPGG